MRRIARWLSFAVVATSVASVSFDTQANNLESPCTVKKNGQIDVVVLLDRSLSLTPLMDSTDKDGPRSLERLRQLSDGLVNVAGVLDGVVEDGVGVSLGIINFSTYAIVKRELSPFRSDSEVEILQRELLDPSDLGNSTDYVAALSAATDMFSSSTTSADCRILIWLTDGVFELLPRSDDEGGVRNQDYVNRTVDKLRVAVCEGTGEDPPIASRLHSLEVTTYALMISDEVSTWLSPNIGEGDRLEISKSVRFQASLSAMQAITGDGKPELGGFTVPDVDPVCGKFISGADGGEGPEIPGKLFASSGNLRAYLKTAILISTGGVPFGECPEEISGVWDSPLLPPGNKFEKLSINTFIGEIRELQAIVDGDPRSISLNEQDEVKSTDLQSITDSWRLRIIPNEVASETKFCVVYKMQPLRTEVLTLIPIEPRFESDPAWVGEESISVRIDWSGLQDDDGLDPVGYLKDMEITSPVGEVEVAADFATATISVTQMPDNSLDPQTKQTLNDQFEVVLTPKSELIPPHKLGGRIQPEVLLSNNENQPSLYCDGNDEDLLTLRGESDGKVHESERSCTVSAPKSGVGRLEIKSLTPENRDEILAWVARDADGDELPSVVELRPGDEPLEIRFSTQNLATSRGWSGSGTGALTLTWDENESIQSASFGYDIDFKKPADDIVTLLLIIIMLLVNALLSLVLLWIISRALIQIPRGSKFYLKRVELDVGSSDDLRRQSSFDDLKAKLREVRHEPVRDSRQRSTLEFAGFTLEPHIPFLPPFKAPILRVAPSGHVRAIPNAAEPSSVFVPFSALILLKADPSKFGARTTVSVLVLYPSGTPDIEALLRPHARKFDEALKSIVAELSVRPTGGSEKEESGPQPGVGGHGGRGGKKISSEEPKPPKPAVGGRKRSERQPKANKQRGRGGRSRD